MKLTKENVYVNLQGKSKEELTDLWEFLTSNGEIVSDNKEYFVETHLKYNNSFIALGSDNSWKWWGAYEKTEVTIEQLKEILQPMGTEFTPIAMRCTQEQFDAVKPKLKDLVIRFISDFNSHKYLVNNVGNIKNSIGNILERAKSRFDRKVYEEWNEEIFLKACGIEDESLEQQLQKAKAEVKRLEKEIKEENKIKVGDWVFIKETGTTFKAKESDLAHIGCRHRKITNPQLIELLENEIK